MEDGFCQRSRRQESSSLRARKGCIDAIILSKPPLGVASLRSNLSFLVIFMTKARSLRSSRPQILSLRAKRGNLSFDCPPTPNNRDRHVPRDRKSCHCEPARQSLISGSLRDKGEIATFLAMTGVFCQSPLWGCDFFVIASAAWQSLFCWRACERWCHCERSAAISPFWLSS